MDRKLIREYLVELIGTAIFIYLAAGLVCVNEMTRPEATTTAALSIHQPGLLGVAIGQGVFWMTLLAITMPISGGCLNPAIAVALWVFNRLSTHRLAWFLGAQLIGSVLGCVLLRLTFSAEILQSAKLGVPHLNPLVYQLASDGPARSAIFAGVAIEFLLTFCLFLAIFSPRDAGSFWRSGAILVGCVLFAFPLTGAALNPARWFGPTFLGLLDSRSGDLPWRDAIVYVIGPTLGAFAGAVFCFKAQRS